MRKNFALYPVISTYHFQLQASLYEQGEQYLLSYYNRQWPRHSLLTTHERGNHFQVAVLQSLQFATVVVGASNSLLLGSVPCITGAGLSWQIGLISSQSLARFARGPCFMGEANRLPINNEHQTLIIHAQ